VGDFLTSTRTRTRTRTVKDLFARSDTKFIRNVRVLQSAREIISSAIVSVKPLFSSQDNPRAYPFLRGISLPHHSITPAILRCRYLAMRPSSSALKRGMVATFLRIQEVGLVKNSGTMEHSCTLPLLFSEMTSHTLIETEYR
jgi:hypothetical protein